MGIGGISIWQLVIILVIVLLLFGTKKLRTLGGDLGGAIKGFKKAMSEEKPEDADKKDAEKVEDNSEGSADTMKQNSNEENKTR